VGDHPACINILQGLERHLVAFLLIGHASHLLAA
jgi:hypothetical protein